MQNLHPPPVQFKLYQGEVLRRGLYQGLGGIHPVPTKVCTRDWVQSTQSETPEGAFQSERGLHRTGTSESIGTTLQKKEGSTTGSAQGGEAGY